MMNNASFDGTVPTVALCNFIIFPIITITLNIIIKLIEVSKTATINNYLYSCIVVNPGWGKKQRKN